MIVKSFTATGGSSCGRMLSPAMVCRSAGCCSTAAGTQPSHQRNRRGLFTAREAQSPVRPDLGIRQTQLLVRMGHAQQSQFGRRRRSTARQRLRDARAPSPWGDLRPTSSTAPIGPRCHASGHARRPIQRRRNSPRSISAQRGVRRQRVASQRTSPARYEKEPRSRCRRTSCCLRLRVAAVDGVRGAAPRSAAGNDPQVLRSHSP